MSKALIIGGGIGGLTTALALQHVGIDVTVFERSHTAREQGAGLTLWLNAVRLLQKLGLEEALREIGMPLTQICFYTQDGMLLTERDIEELAQKYGAPSLAVHRAELQAALLRALGDGIVQYDSHCIGVTQDGGKVCAHFADGRGTYGDVLIGADGIYSVVREQLFDQTRPRYAGYSAWRGVTSFSQPFFSGGKACETWGRGVKFGAVPLTHSRIYWYISLNTPEGRKDCSKSRLLEYVRGWHEPIEALIAATDETSILQTDIYDRRPLRTWGHGSITLLGDAAHPMTPNLGQGACQAIEDAFVLAVCLRGASDPLAIQRALHLYEVERNRRTRTVVHQSRLLGQISQWEHPLACALRNKLLKDIPDNMQAIQFERIVGYGSMPDKTEAGKAATGQTWETR